MAADYGYKIIFSGQVHAARTPEDAAPYLLAAREFGKPVRAKRCTSLTRERDVNAAEQQALIAAACALVAR